MGFNDKGAETDAAKSLGFPSINALAKAAGVNGGTISYVRNGKRPLSDGDADKLVRAIMYKNGTTFLDAAYELAEVLFFLQQHRSQKYGSRVREIPNTTIKRWHANYLDELKQAKPDYGITLALENLELPTSQLLQQVLTYLRDWDMKHDFRHLDKMQQFFRNKKPVLIVPSLDRGKQEGRHYEIMRDIYAEIRYIAHLCREYEFVEGLSRWFITQSQQNNDVQTEVQAKATLAWVLTSQKTSDSLRIAQQYVDEIWEIVNSNAFIKRIRPEYMDVIALLTELRLRLAIRNSAYSTLSLDSIDFEDLLKESKQLLKRPNSFHSLDYALQKRYEIPLDYQYGVYLWHCKEYNQAVPIFESIAEETNFMGWVRVEQASYSWLATAYEALGEYKALSEILQKLNVVYLANRQEIRAAILKRLERIDA